MVTFYYKLVKAGKLMIEEVPVKYREAVRKMIEAEGNHGEGET